MANINRILASSKKMLMTAATLYDFHCLSKALHAIRPLAFQLLLFGYIFAFQLPKVMVKYLGTGGNSAFVRGAHKAQYGKDKTGFDPHQSMAITMGPGEAECRTSTDEESPQRYGDSVLARAKDSGAWFLDFTAYYRDGLAFDKWEKSIHTLGAFHNIEVDNENSSMKSKQVRKRRKSSASSTLFSEPCASSLKAPATIVWGRKDQACSEPICLDGIGDYLTRDSHVLILPDTGHWTPFEKPSRETLKRILEQLVQNGDIEKVNLQDIVKETYPGAYVSIEK
jgi:pimeloyl-ACP methyl ester carboxylesterase